MPFKFFKGNKAKILAFVGALISAGVVITQFQNCSGGFNQTQGDSLILASTLNSTNGVGYSTNPAFSSFPFPYKANVNQLAYMSCSVPGGSQALSAPFFTFAVGAFNPKLSSGTAPMVAAGLSLDPTFLQSLASYSQNSATNESFFLQQYLNSVPVQMNLALRDINLTSSPLVLVGSGTTPAYTDILDVMTNSAYSSQIATNLNGTYTGFPYAATESTKYLQATLSSGVDWTVQNQFRTSTIAQNYLSIGYFNTASTSTTTTGTPVTLSPSTDTTGRFILGTGYQLSFAPPVAALGFPITSTGIVQLCNAGSAPGACPTGTYNAANYNGSSGATFVYDNSTVATINGVTEYDLSSKTQLKSSWDCTRKFKIVMPQDRYNPIHVPIANMWKYGIYNPLGGNPGAAPAAAYASYGVPAPTGWTAGYNIHSVTSTINGSPSTPFSGIQTIPTVPACPPEDYASVNADTLAIARRFMSADDWDINTTVGCAVPKNVQSGCYSTAHYTYDEIFNPQNNVDPADYPELGVPSCGANSGAYECANWVTLCIKTQ